jgi:hypothetical protein
MSMTDTTSNITTTTASSNILPILFNISDLTSEQIDQLNNLTVAYNISVSLQFKLCFV